MAIKYISVPTGDEVDIEVPLDDLVELHKLGYTYTRQSMVYESNNDFKLVRPAMASDFLYEYIGTFVNLPYNLKFKIYKSGSDNIRCFNKLKYIQKLCGVSFYNKKLLDNDLQLWLKSRYNYSLSVENLVTKMYLDGLYNIEMNNISLCSTVTLIDYCKEPMCIFKFIFNIKSFVYN